MGINLKNYEQYFLDHLEGRLSPEMEKELSEFTALHPELTSLLEGFEGTSMRAEPVAYPQKNRLKKDILPTTHIHENNYEEWMLDSLEGLLSEKDSLELSRCMEQNPALTAEMALFRMTKLPAIEDVVFPE